MHSSVWFFEADGQSSPLLQAIESELNTRLCAQVISHVDFREFFVCHRRDRQGRRGGKSVLVSRPSRDALSPNVSSVGCWFLWVFHSFPPNGLESIHSLGVNGRRAVLTRPKRIESCCHLFVRGAVCRGSAIVTTTLWWSRGFQP
jgi:hypothetical protein